MLEKMFTTKMSMDKKKLQNRFSKIRSKNGKTSKFIAMAVFAVIIVSIICVSIWVAVNREDDTVVNSDIKLTFNGEIISFQNDPYIFSETLPTGFNTQTMAFFPLEELCQKLGAECEKNFNEAVIKIPGANDNYRISLGKNEIYYESLIGASATRETKFAPEAKNNALYIPYEFIEYIFIDGNNYDIFGSTLYKNETMNIQFELPMHWLGKYIADETTVNDSYIAFKHKGIAEKPIDKTEHGIWIVRSYKLVEPLEIKEILFHNVTHKDNKSTAERALKRDDGWYNLLRDASVYINFNGAIPQSVIAKFTPAGTEMQEYEKEVGRAIAPFEQIPILINMSFSKEDTMGHLQFEFNFEDGSMVKSELFNVLIEH